tara:strand:+ start:5440 stop:5970 length:531 start_codon:yes stop_codon:yes gene_type:complete
MLYYWLNLIYIYVGSKFFWTKIDLDSELTRTRRVRILDCDSLRYMANSKYFYYMDFIRFEVMFRSNLYENTFKKGIFPVLGSQKIIYKKPLKRWAKFKVTIVLEGWDDKWGYHSQVFKQNNEICAIGYTKFAFWKDKKALHLPSILADCGIKKEDTNPPSEVLNMFKNDYEIIKSN